MRLPFSRPGLFTAVLIAALLLIPVAGQLSPVRSGEGITVQIKSDDEVVKSCMECHLELHGNPMEIAGKGLKVGKCTPCHEWMHKQPVPIRTQNAKIRFRRRTGDFDVGRMYEGQLTLKQSNIYLYPERHLRISPGRLTGLKFVKEQDGYVFFTVFLPGALTLDEVEVTFVPMEFQAGQKKATITPDDIDEMWFQRRLGGYASLEDYRRTYSQVDSGPGGGGVTPLAFEDYDIPATFGRAAGRPPGAGPRPARGTRGPQAGGRAISGRPLPGNRPRRAAGIELKPLGQVVFTYNLEKARPYHFVARPDGQVVAAGSNQIALWIEDEDGYYVDTVFVTRLAGRKGYRFNPATLPTWRRASRWDLVSREEADAVSGATQKPGAKTLVWDCRDWHGNPVKPGKYTYRLEANLQMANLAVWTGQIEIGPQSRSSEATLRRIPPGNTAYLFVKGVEALFEPASTRPTKTLYLCPIIHNEEDFNGTRPTGRADFDGDRQILTFTTGRYRRLGKLFQKYGAKINLQCDWTFADGVKKFDSKFFGDWESMGHETDAHAHESHISYLEVKNRLKVAGANPTRNIGGTLEETVQQRILRFEDDWPEFEVLWGAAVLKHSGDEENTRYVWRPATTGSWFNHDPDGKIIYIGGNMNPMDVETVRQAYGSARADKVNVYSVFLGSFENADRPETRADLSVFEEFLKGIRELQGTCDVQWKSLTEVAEIFKTREAEGTLDFSDVDVNAIPRSKPGAAIQGGLRRGAIRKSPPGREADYNNDGVVDEIEIRLWRQGGPRSRRRGATNRNSDE